MTKAIVHLAAGAALLAAATVPAAPLVINEFVASNHGGHTDFQGDTPDWIELHNAGTEPVALEGWGLSDDADNPRRWVFEQGIVEPGGFLVVFASGKDRQDAFEPHTNFAISSAGEPLLLTGPDGHLVDFVPETPLPVNVSFGRKPDAGQDWLYFKEPTPGAPNTSAGHVEVLEPPSFSHEGGFRTEPFELTLETDHPGAQIIYTLDGSEPTPDKIGGFTYHYKQQYAEFPGDPLGELLERTIESHYYDGKSIPIADRSDEPDRIAGVNTTLHRDTSSFEPLGPSFKGTVVRARTVREDAIPSRTVTHTYFVTPDGRDRYGLPVVSLAIQEDHLFDYENGIYVAGVDYDDWRIENPDGQFTPGPGPDKTATEEPSQGFIGNFTRRGREWEYPVHLEYYEAGARADLRQNLGFRIHGGGTRAVAMKSFRLYARNAYDDTNVLDYPFFDYPGFVDSAEGRPIKEFRRMILRNSGQDYFRTMLGDGFLQRILRPLGLDYQEYSPAVVFVNGEFFGIMNFRERIDQHYLAARHLVDPDDVAILTRNAEIRHGDERHREDFLALREFITNEDIAGPDAYAHVESEMDTGNFIRYKAAQIYTRNLDWPGRNIDYWRKATPDLSEGAPPAHDGRWRWIVFDLDIAMVPVFDQDASHDTLTAATLDHNEPWPNPDWSKVKLRRLLENETFRHAFINELADQKNSIFRPAHYEPILDRMHERIDPHLDEHRTRWSDSARFSIDDFKEFGEERPAWIRQHTINYFDLPGTATITLDTPNPRRGTIRINSLNIAPHLEGLEVPLKPFPWTGTYFQSVPVEIEAIPKAGFRFSHWDGDLGGEGPLAVLAPLEELRATAIFVPDEGYPWDTVLPQPHRLSEVHYRFDAWPAGAPAGTFPPNIVFRQTPVGDPLLADEPDGLWGHPYALDNRSRVIGLNGLGAGFINTSNPQEDGGGYVTGAELALDTRDLLSAQVAFTARTVLPNERTYALRLQYRIGPEGRFHDLLDSHDKPVEYIRHPTPGHEERIGPVALPRETIGQEYVSLRWKYYFIETGASGPRAMLAMDDVSVEGEVVADMPFWVFR